MKKLLLIYIFIATSVSCIKEETQNCSGPDVNAKSDEVAKLQTYIDTNNIVAVKDPRGFFYHIDSAGSGTKPNLCSGIRVAYEAKSINGTVVDENDDIQFNLNSLINGWKLGVQLIGAGGSIILYLPPSLAYGSAGAGPIPPDAIFISSIQLKEVY